jgi:hypothetical protein
MLNISHLHEKYLPRLDGDIAYEAAAAYIVGVGDFADLASRPLPGSFLDNAESR